MSSKQDKMNGFSKKGFTLAEVLITAGILVMVIGGLLQLFIYCSILSESTGNMAMAMADAQTKMEEIRNHTYSDITTDYVSGGTPGNTFNLTLGNGKGAIYIDSSNADLLQIEITVSWMNNRNNRYIGEDLDLDGAIDAGEDVDGDSKLDSPVDISSYIAAR